MEFVELFWVDRAFREGAARNVTVIRRGHKEWYFTFQLDPRVILPRVKGGTGAVYALRTQRKELRTWADPRNLFEFLSERGITAGRFSLEDEYAGKTGD